MINDAIILLAGLGSRLRPLTDTIHKALIEVGGTTILSRQITILKKFGIQNLHLALGYRADDIQNYIQKHFADMQITYHINPIYDKTNTAYSLMKVIETMSQGFLLLDGDVVFDKNLLLHFKANSGDNLLLCETDQSKLDPEAVKFRTNTKNHIIEIGKQIAVSESAGESIGIGQFQSAFNTTLCKVLKEQLQNPKNANWYYEDAFQWMLFNNTPIKPLIVQSTAPHPWVEIDDFMDLEAANRIFI